jgi:hypothetical protein
MRQGHAPAVKELLMLLAKLSGIARSKGDPRVERTGSGSLRRAGRLARV